MEKFFEVIVIAVFDAVIALIPDLVVAGFIQWFGQLTGIQYLADASFWQGFWLAVLVSTTIMFASIANSASD